MPSVVSSPALELHDSGRISSLYQPLAYQQGIKYLALLLLMQKNSACSKQEDF